MSNIVNIAGLDKAQVLAALFNYAGQQGLGVLEQDGTRRMTVEEAREMLDTGRTHFEYVRGRVMKIDLDSDELDVRLYNRDNGEGAVQATLEHLRK